MQKNIIGDKSQFAIEYAFYDDTHKTEIAMFVGGRNILAFERNGEHLTTRWNIDDLAIWLRKFIDEMKEDPFPFDCAGENAAQKDDSARDFDSEDDEEFERYYEKLSEWNAHHRWHGSSSGAILADVFFQKIGDDVEISWDNRNSEDEVSFSEGQGCAYVPKKVFCNVVDTFLKEYAHHWFD